MIVNTGLLSFLPKDLENKILLSLDPYNLTKYGCLSKACYATTLNVALWESIVSSIGIVIPEGHLPRDFYLTHKFVISTDQLLKPFKSFMDTVVQGDHAEFTCTFQHHPKSLIKIKIDTTGKEINKNCQFICIAKLDIDMVLGYKNRITSKSDHDRKDITIMGGISATDEMLTIAKERFAFIKENWKEEEKETCIIS